MVGRRLLGAGVAALVICAPVSAATLNDAVRQAIETNPDVRIETNELLSREQEIEQAKSGFYPQVDLTAGYGYERSDNATTRGLGLSSRELTRKEAGITLTQMLFDGFATRSEVERQSARVQSTLYRIEGVSQNRALDAVESYLNVLRYRELLSLTEENLASHDRVYEQVDLRNQAGIGRSSDLEQVRGRRASANASRLSEVANLKDAESSYLHVVGALPAELEAAPSVGASLPTNLKRAMQIALEEHPTLLSAKADVEATLAQHAAAGHNYYPKFNLELGSTWGEDQNGAVGEEDDLTAMIRMNFNLYSGGKDKARKRQTAHLINEAKEVRNRTYRQVVESLRLSWTAYQATRAQLAPLKQHLVSSQNTRDAYVQQFNIGKRTLLDLLNTENEVFQAKRAYKEAEYDALFAEYRILASVGQLLGSFDLKPPRGEGAGDEMLQAYAELAPQAIAPATFESRPEHGFIEEEAMEEAPAPAVKPGNPGIESMLEGWRNAWQGKDIEAYLAQYSDGFRSAWGASKAPWAEKRRSIIANSREIDIRLENISSRVDGESATVRFTQRYNSANYSDVVNKRLDLSLESGEWKITREVTE